MNNLFYIVKANAKRLLKRPLVLVMSVILPLFLIIVLFSKDGGPSNAGVTPIAIVYENYGEYEIKLKDTLGDKAVLYPIEKYDEAISSLKKNELISVIVLDKNFSSDIKNSFKPQIRSIKTADGGGAMLLENAVENFINNSIKEINNIPVDNVEINVTRYNREVTPDIAISIAFLGYFLLLSTTDICKDILNLRKTKVLKRTLSTANSNITILAGIFLSTFIVFVILGAISVFLAHILLKIPMEYYFVNFMLTVAMAFLALAFTIFTTRLFNNEILVMMSLVLLAIGTFLPGIMTFTGIIYGTASTSLTNIAQFTPFYWILDGVYNQQLFPNMFIILLIGLVLFTAGSFKLNKYVE